MQVINIDVLDGNGLIPVAVCTSVQAIRLEQFARWAAIGNQNKIDAAVIVEREACAKACEAELIGTGKNDHESDRAYDRALGDAAKAIRMRPNQNLTGG